MARYTIISGTDTFVEDGDGDVRSEFDTYEDAVSEAKDHAQHNVGAEYLIAKIVGKVTSQRPPEPAPIVAAETFED